LLFFIFRWAPQRDDGDSAGLRLVFLFEYGLRNPGERYPEECDMKNTKWMGTWAIAAAGALTGALCVVHWMPLQAAPAAQIAVAAVDIDVGQHLAPRFIKLVASPTGKVPAGEFSDPHKLDGRILTASVERGEPLVERQLQPTH
jgi:hypothetical protein